MKKIGLFILSILIYFNICTYSVYATDNNIEFVKSFYTEYLSLKNQNINTKDIEKEYLSNTLIKELSIRSAMKNFDAILGSNEYVGYLEKMRVIPERNESWVLVVFELNENNKKEVYAHIGDDNKIDEINTKNYLNKKLESQDTTIWANKSELTKDEQEIMKWLKIYINMCLIHSLQIDNLLKSNNLSVDQIKNKIIETTGNMYPIIDYELIDQYIIGKWIKKNMVIYEFDEKGICTLFKPDSIIKKYYETKDGIYRTSEQEVTSDRYYVYYDKEYDIAVLGSIMFIVNEYGECDTYIKVA